MAKIVRCPECRIKVEVPEVLKPRERLFCPDCDARLPVGEPKAKPRKPLKRKKKPEPQPFWKSRIGKILSGVGFILVGGLMIAGALLTDVGKPIKLIIGGALAILLGCGSLGYGFFADESDSEADDDDGDSGGLWDDE